MKFIEKEYGTEANLLELTAEEYYKVIEPFLMAHGVRSRITLFDNQKCVIQAENVYKTWMSDSFDRKCAEDHLTGFRLDAYKR